MPAASGPIGFFQKLSVLNQLLRTGLVLILTGVVGGGAYLGYERYVKPAQELATIKADLQRIHGELAEAQETVQQQRVEIGQLNAENDRLTTSLRLIKVDRRLAYLTVTDTGLDPETGIPLIKVLFTEVDEAGKQVGPRRVFTLQGTLLNVDCWLAKFDDKYIEEADLLRGSTLCIIRGIRGDRDQELQLIDQGTAYPDKHDPRDQRPDAYRSLGDTSDLEQKIWSDFWRVANDVQQQEALGLRAVHGQVNYIQVEAGATYQLDLRASDGGSLRRIERPPTIALPTPDDA